MRNWIWIDTVLFPLYLCFSHALPRPWIFDAGMYEPLYLTFDAYPSVVPPVRVRGVMALFLAVSILWALIWYVSWKNIVVRVGDLDPSPLMVEKK